MDYPRILRELMSITGLKQAPLAKRLRVEQATISRWLRGAQPKVQQHNRIVAEAKRVGLQLEPAEIVYFSGHVGTPGRMVRVVGYVGAGATTHYYAVAQGDLDEVPAPEGATDTTVAVEIRGDSLGSIFDRWLVFYDDVRRPVTTDLVGQLCVVGLSDDRILVKKIKAGLNGLYDLYSNFGDEIVGVAIEWAAKVKTLSPR